MQSHRISIDIDKDQHKKLKIYCAQLGITVKEFVLSSINDKMNMCWLDNALKNQDQNKEEE